MSRTQRSICLLGWVGLCLGKCLHYIRLWALCLLRLVREARLMVTRTELVTVQESLREMVRPVLTSCISPSSSSRKNILFTKHPPRLVGSKMTGKEMFLVFSSPHLHLPPAPPHENYKTMLSSSALPALCPFLLLDAEWVPWQRMIRQRQREEGGDRGNECCV